jgi:hypothetical protein
MIGAGRATGRRGRKRSRLNQVPWPTRFGRRTRTLGVPLSSRSQTSASCRDLAQGSDRSAAISRKLPWLEAELQNTKKDFECQIHELFVQPKEAKMRYKDVKAMFVGQFEQVKEEQEPAVALARKPRGKSEIQKDVDQKFKVAGGFALGLSISVINLISDGVTSFSRSMSECHFQFQVINAL